LVINNTIKIKKIRQEGRPIFYLDETWLNAGHTKQKIWYDETIKNSREAFNQGLSTGLKSPSGKGKRLIILHIGSEDGFVDDGLLLFEGIKQGDYHDEMNANKFEEWFTNILTKLPANSVIVMDNASYHSRVVEKIPNSSWKKVNIQNWLKSKQIVFDKTFVKAELLQLVKIYKPIYNKHVVDLLAEEKNMMVLRLPPYHCELNPIELVWAFIKNDVAANNTTFKFSDVKILFQQALAKVLPEHWKNNIEHVKKVESQMWEIDNLTDSTIEEIIINIVSDSSSTEWSDDEKEN
jgi:transposase